MSTNVLEYVRSLAGRVPTPVAAGLGDFPWTQRVSSLDMVDGKARLTFFSDGLTLAQKGALEAFLSEALAREAPNLGEVTIFFERKNKPAATEAPEPPPRAEPPNPFNPQHMPGIRHVVLVGSGKGGVGKSTVSTNLAVAMAQLGLKVGIFDADVYGPNIPTMFGCRGEALTAENDKVIPPERHGVKIMSMGLIAPEDVAIIWRGPMITKFIQQAFVDIAWGELDVLVIDLPPGTGDTQISLAQQVKVSGAVIVTTPQTVALQDAQKAIAMFQKTDIPVLGVVENMASYLCPHCGHESHIFGNHGADHLTGKFDLPLLARIPLVGTIREGGDAGCPVTSLEEGPVAAAFVALAREVCHRMDSLQS